PELYDVFKKLRNRVQSLIREAKKEHLAAFNCKRGIASTWGELKRLGLIGSSVRNNRCNFDLDVLNNAFILSSSPHPVTQSVCSVSSLHSGDCGRLDETELFFADIPPKVLINAILKGRSEAMGVDLNKMPQACVAFLAPLPASVIQSHVTRLTLS
ncbi:dna mismatch repair protein, partial [Lasius niger]